eukprot:9504096-Pyramimonas_sp.AAC.3
MNRMAAFCSRMNRMAAPLPRARFGAAPRGHRARPLGPVFGAKSSRRRHGAGKLGTAWPRDEQVDASLIPHTRQFPGASALAQC